MIFKIEYWPSLRSRLLAEKQQDTPEGRLAERLFHEGSAVSDNDFVAYLEYKDKCGHRAMLTSLTLMPTPADGAIEIIRANFSRTWVFHNPQELALWEYEIPENKRAQFRKQINQFLLKRKKEAGYSCSRIGNSRR